MDISDPAVSLAVYIFNKVFHAIDIIGNDSDRIIKYVVDCNDRYVTGDQLSDFRIPKIDTGYGDSIKSSVSGPFQIGHLLGMSLAAVDQGQIIVIFLNAPFKTVQDMIEIIMGQAALRFVYKENAYISGFIGLEHLGCRIGEIPEFLGLLPYQFLRFRADVMLIVERLAYSSHRYIACSSDIFQRNHFSAPAFLHY